MVHSRNRKYIYKGLVTQDDFNIRFGFSQARIAIGYTQEEVSFLMGKLPYFYGEYEEMRDGTKLTEEENILLPLLFKTSLSSPIRLDRDDFGYGCKRLIKGEREEKQGVYHYTLHHPWLVRVQKGKIEIKENLPIRFTEIPFQLEAQQEKQAIALFAEAVNWLFHISFFQYPQSPLQIYERIRLAHHDPVLRPRFLKEVLYRLIANKTLLMKTINGGIHYVAAV